jgi:hypothetical protein
MRARAWGQAHTRLRGGKKTGASCRRRTDNRLEWGSFSSHFANVLVCSEFTLWGKNGDYEVREVRYFVVCLYMARFPLLSP